MAFVGCLLVVPSRGLFVHVREERRNYLVSLPLLRRTAVLPGQGPALMMSLTLITSLKAVSPYTVTLEVKASTSESGRT